MRQPIEAKRQDKGLCSHSRPSGVDLIVLSAIANRTRRGAVLLGSERQFGEKLIGLTRMQLVVLGYLLDGFLNKQIAAACGIQEATVKAHIGCVLRILKVRSRTEAAVKFAILCDRYQQRQLWVSSNVALGGTSLGRVDKVIDVGIDD